jgi:hypothetical protein
MFLGEGHGGEHVMLRVVHDGCEADLVGECRFDLSEPAERQALHSWLGRAPHVSFIGSAIVNWFPAIRRRTKIA